MKINNTNCKYKAQTFNTVVFLILCILLHEKTSPIFMIPANRSTDCRNRQIYDLCLNFEAKKLDTSSAFCTNDVSNVKLV